MTLLAAVATMLSSAHAATIRLDVKPRICTLSGKDTQCETPVRAAWRSSQRESLCLVIVDHPQVKRCWENFARGTYSVELVFSEDLLIELRDPQLQTVLASKAIQVIREALEFRRKRRQPWNLIY
jgi:hypothetical protein